MEELFLSSCSDGSLTTCVKLIRKNINVNCFDDSGQTGLMKACMNNHYEIAKTLIKSGANVNQIDRYGQNAMHFANKAKNERLLKLLCTQENANSKQCTNISCLTVRDLCLLTTNTKLNDDDDDDVEPYLYDILFNYEKGVVPEISDVETDDEKTGGEVYKKEKKKKKKGGKSGKKKKSGKSGKSKKKKK